jgi:hypothetical protein
MSELKVFVCIDHEGHEMEEVASVIFAHTELEARKLLEDELTEYGLKSNTWPFTLREINGTSPKAFILRDGAR